MVAAGLAAVFVTASRAPQRRLASGYGARLAPAPPEHQARLRLGKTSCEISWSNAGGIAVCPGPGSLPPHGIAAIRAVLEARAGRASLNCARPMSQPAPVKTIRVVPCVAPGTGTASFSIKLAHPWKGGPNAIAVNTFGSIAPAH